MTPAKPRKLPLHKLIPNMITLSAMAAGISSIKFAINGQWDYAVLSIVAAAFMDGIDGAAARLLKASSKLGAELDSLSDFVSFGVAPAIVIFLWSTQSLGRWGWFLSLAYAMALALRLARFNIMKEEQDDKAAASPLSKYFTGVPSPAAAGLCLLPMILALMSQERGLGFSDALRHPLLVGIWALIVGGLAVSHMPTFSSKQIRVPYSMKIPALGLFALFVAGLINDPWPTLALLGMGYVAALPFGVVHYDRKRKSLADGHAEDDETDD